MTVFVVETFAAVMAVFLAETSAFKEEVGEEELSLFMAVTTAEGSIIGKLLLEK